MGDGANLPDGNKCLLFNHFDRCRAEKPELISPNQNTDSDPPEVGYLLIIATLAKPSSGENTDLRPTP